jgi:hypothetical protein
MGTFLRALERGPTAGLKRGPLFQAETTVSDYAETLEDAGIRSRPCVSVDGAGKCLQLETLRNNCSGLCTMVHTLGPMGPSRKQERYGGA